MFYYTQVFDNTRINYELILVCGPIKKMQRLFQDLLYSLPLCVKREPYVKYKKFPETVDKVIILLRNYANPDMKEIAQ